MASGRKAFHFDLDEEKLKALYPSESKTGYKGAWSKIQAFMESNGFEHTQYSGYEFVQGMEYADAYTVLDNLQGKFPWFKDCAKVATLTNIGKRHDVLEHLAGKFECDEEPLAEMEQEPPAVRDRVTLEGEVRSMRAASKALDEQGAYSETTRDIESI